MSAVAANDQIAVVEEWLYQTLVADQTLAALGIHADEVPEGEGLPAVVYQFRGGSDLRGVGPTLVWANLLYLVKVIGQGRSTLALTPYTRLISQRLHAASGATVEGTVLMCVREGLYKLPEYTDGEHYRHVGAFWRIYAQ